MVDRNCDISASSLRLQAHQNGGMADCLQRGQCSQDDEQRHQQGQSVVSQCNGTTLCLPCVDERYPNHWPDMIPCFLSNNTKRLIRKHNEGTTLVANAVRLHCLHTPYCPKRSVRERLSQPFDFPRQIGKDFKFPTRQQGQNVGPLRLMSASSWPWRWKGRRAD